MKFIKKLRFCLPLLLLFFCHPAKAYSYIQSCSVTINNPNVQGCTLPAPVGPNHLLVALFFSCGNRGAMNTFVSDTFLLTWSPVGTSANTSGDCNFRNTNLEMIYASTGLSSGSETVTFDMNSGNLVTGAFIVAEYSGTTIPVIQDPAGSAPSVCSVSCGSTGSSGTITTTLANDLLISGGMTYGTIAPSGGYTIRATTNDPDNCNCGGVPIFIYLADKSSGAPGPYAGTWTLSGGSDLYAVIGSFGCVIQPCTNALIVNKFGLTVPPSATIDGVAVNVGGYQTDSDPATKISVHLQLPNGTISPTEISAQLPPMNGTITFGSSSELWGLTLTPTVVNDPLFSVYILWHTTGNPSQIFYIYSVKPTVTFH